MPNLLLKVAFLILFFISNVAPQFYRGELEPRYSRKTPFRQQTDIPDPVFGIGHGARRFSGEKSSREEPALNPFFGERREHGRRNSGREDGRDYEENGEDENRFGRRRRPFDFGIHNSPEEDEDNEERFPRRHGFKRPHQPDPTKVKEIFDKEREERTREREDDGEDEDHQKPRGGTERSGEDERKVEEEEEERPNRPQHRSRNNFEDETDGRRSHRPRHDEESDSERGHHRGPQRGKDQDEESENIAETPSKVVGLNMQMVAGVYPKEKKGPEVEDVEKRGGRLVEKADQREKNKFFRGSEQEERADQRKHQEPEYKEAGDRRPARADSGEVEERSRGERRREEERGGRRDESDEQPHKERIESEESPENQQQPQRNAPPPPKPQIPPFPAFPKFPSFGGFQPFQPDFPTRSIGSNGGFTGGPWNPPGRTPGREATLGEDVGSSEERSGQDGRRVHQQNPSSTPSHNSGSHDDSAERGHPPSDHSKDDERGRGEDDEKRGKVEAQRDGRERSSESGENRRTEEIEEKVEHTYSSPDVASQRKEFPKPGRFVTNIRAKKSGEILNAPTALPMTSTASTTQLSSAITFPAASITSTTPLSTGIVLPAEAIATKLRSIVNQRIKVA